jgi:glyoxylase-like metal-dependent hydrolase (beta-lactamase superfamily II)
MQRWRVGEVEVVAVFETDAGFGPDFVRRLVPGATREALRSMPWLVPHWADAEGDAHMVVQCFGLVSRGVRIVVDTCIGNDKERRNPAFHKLATPFLERLGAAGFAPEAVDVVVCTHLHFDHVGWNTRWDGARWVPTFPRARYLVEARELAHWRQADPKAAVGLLDSVEPVAAAGLLAPFELGEAFAVTDEVSLVPTPGHTLGHLSVRIASEGRTAWITGDAIHHPCQIAHPEWTSPADCNRAQAEATRRRLLEAVEGEGGLLLGTHFAPPAAGWVREGAEGRWLEAESGEGPRE